MSDKSLLKVPGEAIDKAAADVISTLAGDTAKGIVSTGENLLGGLIGDRLKEWRTRNLINSAAKTAELLKQKGIRLSDVKALPNGEIYRLFEGASKADSDIISDLWAGLLANAMNPNSDISVESQFTSVLEQLTVMDVRLIDFIRYHQSRVKKMREEFPEGYVPYGLNFEDNEELKLKKRRYDEIRNKAAQDIENKFKELKIEDESKIQAAIENLVRLNIIFLSENDIDIELSGLLESVWRDVNHRETIDPSRLHNILDEIINHLKTSQELWFKENPKGLFTDNSSDNVYLNYEFSRFGVRFIQSCYI